VAVAVATDLLEASGRQVEISYGFMTLNPYQSSRISVMGFVTPIKHANDPINVTSLVNILSPWYYRTVAFGMMDSQSDLQTMHHRGQPVQVQSKLWDQMRSSLGVPENSLEIKVPHILTHDSARKFIETTIKAAEANQLI
jgi:hypothetical protein